MPALAKIQPKRINLVQLVKSSGMSPGNQTYWLNELPRMSLKQKGELAKTLLDLQDGISEQDVRSIEKEAKEAGKCMWRKAEEITRAKEQRNADKILNVIAQA